MYESILAKIRYNGIDYTVTLPYTSSIPNSFVVLNGKRTFIDQSLQSLLICLAVRGYVEPELRTAEDTPTARLLRRMHDYLDVVQQAGTELPEFETLYFFTEQYVAVALGSQFGNYLPKSKRFNCYYKITSPTTVDVSLVSEFSEFNFSYVLDSEVDVVTIPLRGTITAASVQARYKGVPFGRMMQIDTANTNGVVGYQLLNPNLADAGTLLTTTDDFDYSNLMTYYTLTNTKVELPSGSLWFMPRLTAVSTKGVRYTFKTVRAMPQELLRDVINYIAPLARICCACDREFDLLVSKSQALSQEQVYALLDVNTNWLKKCLHIR